ncbi:MAG: hypothetical protein ACLUEZ_12500 [Oscillospiraceae bacterium]|uniref:hypothetical protein n=1 Tax=Hominilimicola sp. TaxID=3073571 RepID=UPI001DCD041D|nr:hypothetical protein [Bacillota bacterium]
MAIHTDDFCSFERKIAFAFIRKAKKIIKIFIAQNAEKQRAAKISAACLDKKNRLLYNHY